MARYIGDKFRLGYSDRVFKWYKDNPVYAVKDILGIEPIWFQRMAIQEMSNKPFCMLNWGRGTSKSFTEAIQLLLDCLFNPYSFNGILCPVYRQSLFIMDYIDAIKEKSPFVKNSITHETRGNMGALKVFGNYSKIEALPVGDGSKIRGRRYNKVTIDEYAQMSEDVIEGVVKPMLSIKQKGIDNKLRISSTAYWKFNHYYTTYKIYKNKSKTEPNIYSLTEFDFRDILNTPEDLRPFEVDMNIINEAKETSPKEIFEMEYCSIFPSEMSSFFSPRLIDNCTPKAEPFEVEMQAVKGQYTLGVDPIEGQSDNFSICVLKLVNGLRIPVRIIVIPPDKATFPVMAQAIRNASMVYDAERINMDSGGGGRALRDMLRDEWVDIEGKKHPPILEAEDIKDGIKVLKMVNFSSSKIHDLYMNFKSDMQNKIIKFPLDITCDPDDEIEKAYREIILLKREMLLLQAKARGVYLYFEASKGFKKDRITSLVLANDAARELLSPAEIIQEQPKGFIIGSWM